ncbi:MAG: hypothetical protein JKY93_01150 [Gammaproteobacteria bacterium]|nr:hypothetical protein [Gammaproteobacteria bacterium]
MNNIRVLITPLHYDGIYGDEVDVTKDIDITSLVKDNLGKISREIDNGDFDFGVFVFGSITLRCYNDEGFFSMPEDSRSIFKYRRDLARVKIVYVSTVESVLFEGIINEDTSRDEDLPDDDIKTGTIKFRVLSLDSILRHTKVAGGAIATGVTISTAIKQILNTTYITNVLNFDPSKITVDTDVVIDDGDYFTGASVKEALDELLLAANSILLIDEAHNIIVTPRVENSALHKLYAPHDRLGRGNIMQIKNYNNGLQRCFSAVKINETEIVNLAAVGDYGHRQKSISLDFITSVVSEEIIAGNILAEFDTPRKECVVKVPFDDIAGVKLLDQVEIDYPLQVLPPKGEQFITTVNTFVLGQSKANRVRGSISILPKLRWKIIGIFHGLKYFTTELKIRHVGKEYGQGVI